MWQNENYLRFKDRFVAAKQTFSEGLEEIMFDRLRDPKVHPVLLIFALKAHWREKYGDAVPASDDDAKQAMNQIRALRRAARQKKAAETNTGADANAVADVERMLRG